MAEYDLLHIQGKPFVLVPLHEFRRLTGQAPLPGNLPDLVLTALTARHARPIRILRQYRGLTQQQLAAQAGLSRAYLAEIEAQRKDGSLRVLKAIARELDVPLALLNMTKE